jgi:nucleoside-diphosphate-sugar epimerase
VKRLTRFKIGVVGGSGYIGSRIAYSLSNYYAVKIVDMKAPPPDLQDKVEYAHCSVIDYANVERALNDVNLVIHTAIIQIPLITQEKKMAYEVNLLGTQNVCKIVHQTPSIKGAVLAGSWHVFGERGLDSTIDEEFGYRPDKVEERARLYALSKVGQEIIVRYYDEMSEKVFGVIRMATVLGEGMPEKTAAKIFISRGVSGEPMTPFKHSMYRPMLYVDINDVCLAYKKYADKILNDEVPKEENSLSHIVNLCWPEPITIIDLAKTAQDAIVRLTKKRISPKIEIVDQGQPILYDPADKEKLKANISKLRSFLGMSELTSPKKSIERIVQAFLTESSKNEVPHK